MSRAGNHRTIHLGKFNSGGSSDLAGIVMQAKRGEGNYRVLEGETVQIDWPARIPPEDLCHLLQLCHSLYSSLSRRPSQDDYTNKRHFPCLDQPGATDYRTRGGSRRA